jgi:hypothetical protein
VNGEYKIMRILDCPLRQSGSSASRIQNVCLKVRGMGHKQRDTEWLKRIQKSVIRIQNKYKLLIEEDVYE